MPTNTVKTSVSIDADLIELAKERSKQFDRFGKPNLSAYISQLLRNDLQAMTVPASPTGRFNPHEGKPVLSKHQLEQLKKKGGSFAQAESLLRKGVKKAEEEK